MGIKKIYHLCDLVTESSNQNHLFLEFEKIL